MDVEADQEELLDMETGHQESLDIESSQEENPWTLSKRLVRRRKGSTWRSLWMCRLARRPRMWKLDRSLWMETGNRGPCCT